MSNDAALIARARLYAAQPRTLLLVAELADALERSEIVSATAHAGEETWRLRATKAEAERDAAIERAERAEARKRGGSREMDDAIYLAGKRAGRREGVEASAKVCEARGAKLPLSFKATCMACAAAIRAQGDAKEGT